MGRTGWVTSNESEDLHVVSEGNFNRFFFFDIRDIIHHEYVPEDQAVTGKFYVNVLGRCGHTFTVLPRLHYIQNLSMFRLILIYFAISFQANTLRSLKILI